MQRLARVVAPTNPMLTLAEAKEHLRVTRDAENTLIEALVSAAEEWLDGWRGVLGMAMEPQTWEMSLDRFPVGTMNIPLGPVTSIESVGYVDIEGNSQTMPPAEYEVDGSRVRSVSGWPATDASMGAVTVRFIAGEGTPENIKHVVRLLVGHWYENREAASEKLDAVPMAVDMLINSVRGFRI